MFLISMKELIVVDYQKKLGLVLKYQHYLHSISFMIKSKWINKVFSSIKKSQNQTWLKCCNCNL